MLRNSKVIQKLIEKALINIIIEDHNKQLICSLAELDAYIIILENKQLQIHNLIIDWKQYIIKFNSANCIEKSYLSRGILCIKFVIENKLKNIIGSEKPIAINSKIDIQSVRAKYFFYIA